MRRTIILSLLGLGMLGGVAAADEHHQNRGGYRGGHVERVRPYRDYHAYNRGYYNPRYERGFRYSYGYGRPYYGRHYYDYYHRPALIVEDFVAQPGFIWVRGHWDWNGYEWIWVPGHYQAIAYGYGY